jgi:hypothetical protein
MEATADCTTLTLLTREGALGITFPVRLTEQQYAKLLSCVSDCDTKQEMTEAISMVSNEWGIETIVDDG